MRPVLPRPERPTWGARLRITLLPVLCLVLLLGIGHNVSVGGRLATWDHLLLAHLAGHAGDPWLVVVVAFTNLTSPAALTALACVVVALLLRWERWHEAVTFGGTSLVASPLNAALKTVVHRPRPPLADQLVVESTPSFPSGHTTGAVAVFGALAITAGRIWVSRRLWFRVLAAVLVVLVGLSRIRLGVHWPCDVLAGWLLGGAWLSTSAVLFSAWRRRVETTPTGSVESMPYAEASPPEG